MENLPGVPLWIFEIRSLKNLWNRPSQFYLPTVQFHEIFSMHEIIFEFRLRFVLGYLFFEY